MEFGGIDAYKADDCTKSTQRRINSPRQCDFTRLHPSLASGVMSQLVFELNASREGERAVSS